MQKTKQKIYLDMLCKKQEAKWACIAHLVFVIYSYIKLWPKDVTCQILMHSDQYIKLCPLRVWPFVTLVTSLE